MIQRDKCGQLGLDVLTPPGNVVVHDAPGVSGLAGADRTAIAFSGLDDLLAE